MWRAGSDPVDSQPRGRDRASAQSYPKPDSCTSRADRHKGDRSGTQVDKSCARGRIMASGFSWAPPWRASGPRWLSLRADSSPMITLFPLQGDFCVTALIPRNVLCLKPCSQCSNSNFNLLRGLGLSIDTDLAKVENSEYQGGNNDEPL